MYCYCAAGKIGDGESHSKTGWYRAAVPGVLAWCKSSKSRSYLSSASSRPESNLLCVRLGWGFWFQGEGVSLPTLSKKKIAALWVPYLCWRRRYLNQAFMIFFLRLTWHKIRHACLLLVIDTIVFIVVLAQIQNRIHRFRDLIPH